MFRFFPAILLALSGCTSSAPAPPMPVQTISVQSAPRESVRQLSFQIVQEFPHDPRAFTQGLLYKDGFLYESTGLEGQSDVRKVEIETGTPLLDVDLPPQLFGEGLAYLNNRFYNFTWQNRIGFVRDEKNLQPIAKFTYGNEGWGLTTDGKRLIQSDGTATLFWRDPKNFAQLGQLRVTRYGIPLQNLNELEWIEGKIWANVWQTDTVVIINPASGRVEAEINFAGLLRAEQRTGNEDVLNGIAYDAQNKRIFVTGKLWPKLFEVRVG